MQVVKLLCHGPERELVAVLLGFDPHCDRELVDAINTAIEGFNAGTARILVIEDGDISVEWL